MVHVLSIYCKIKGQKWAYVEEWCDVGGSMGGEGYSLIAADASFRSGNPSTSHAFTFYSLSFRP